MSTIATLSSRIHSALAGADILAVYHGNGVIGCGDTAADNPSTEVAYGEIMIVVSEDCDEVTVGIVWRDEEGDVVDAQDEAFSPDDLDGIVSEVKRLVGGAA